MKLKLMGVTIAALVVGMMLFAGCGNSNADGNKKDANNLPKGDQSMTTNESGNQTPATGGNDLDPINKITDQDEIEWKSYTHDGETYRICELPNGMNFVALEGEEMTRDQINSEIENINRENREKQGQ